MNKKRTLNLIDFQNDFVAPNGALSFDSGKGDLKLIQKTKSFFQNLSTGIFQNAIVTFDTHSIETYPNSQEGKLFPIHCIEKTSGWELSIDKQLMESKIPNIQYLKKATFDMWQASIDTPSTHIIKNTDEVVLFGVASDVCNKAALLGWISKEIPVVIIEDLTRGIKKQTHEVLKEEPFKTAIAKGKIKTISSKNFLNLFQKQRG